MKITTIKKIEELKGQFEEFKEDVEELLDDEEDYIEELAEMGRVSENSENAVASFRSMVEFCDSIEMLFTSIFEF